MITREEILMGRDAEYPLDGLTEANLAMLLGRVNILRSAYDKPMIVTSGYRPGRYNKAANGAPKSGHLFCLAVDFRDKDGALAEWLMRPINLKLLSKIGLWLEDPRFTPGWVHLDVIPRKNTVFIPYGPLKVVS